MLHSYTGFNLVEYTIIIASFTSKYVHTQFDVVV